MRRKILHLTVAVSLVLGVGTAAVWVRSYWRTDAVVYLGPSGHCAIQWARGSLIVGADNVGSPQRRLGLHSWPAEGMDEHIGSGPWNRLGFGSDLTVTQSSTLPPAALTSFPTKPPATIVARRWSVPLWAVGIVLAILLGGMARASFRTWQRRRSGRCVACGYDLRATGARCPECGAVPDTIGAAA